MKVYSEGLRLVLDDGAECAAIRWDGDAVMLDVHAESYSIEELEQLGEALLSFAQDLRVKEDG